MSRKISSKTPEPGPAAAVRAKGARAAAARGVATRTAPPRVPPSELVTQPAVEPGTVVTLAQTVTNRLRAALVGGSFRPDEKLNEESLSAMLQVSRTPVRSALHSLTAEGLLDYVPNRGYSVRGVDLESLTSIFDVRGVLEGLAARLAAERGMDEGQLQAFQDALDEGDRFIEKGRLLTADRRRFGEINARIHHAILLAADNRMLADMIRLCHNVPISSDRNVLWDDYPWLRRSHDDHHRLLDAIRLRDGTRAEHLMREHVLSVKLQMKSRLAQSAPRGVEGKG